jgi:hypothetical protein
MINKNFRGFYQISDRVAQSTIKACTGDGSRDDCCISASLLSSTAIGISGHYNKNGVLIIQDGNKRQTYLNCYSCDREWVISQVGDTITNTAIFDSGPDKFEEIIEIDLTKIP